MKSLLFLICMSAANAADPSLEFKRAGSPVATISLPTMKASLQSEVVEFFNPFYKSKKRYRAFPLRAVLEFAYGGGWLNSDLSEAVFTALDGYASVSETVILIEPGGYLTFEDLDASPGWEKVGRNQSDPGPFFIIWTGKAQETKDHYPWPWALKSVDLIQFRDRYPAVYPEGVKADSSVYRGFLTFKNRCLRCHAIDQEGGKIGPDLNSPKSVLEYRSVKMVRELIVRPSAYRHTKMPDHADLEGKPVEDLISYLRWKSRHRVGEW